ncbi:MAG: hypothetical protein OHK0044_01890 [Burkholderiaceae bacterium]
MSKTSQLNGKSPLAEEQRMSRRELAAEIDRAALKIASVRLVLSPGRERQALIEAVQIMSLVNAELLAEAEKDNGSSRQGESKKAAE